jgi:hypothetical protein
MTTPAPNAETRNWRIPLGRSFATRHCHGASRPATECLQMAQAKKRRHSVRFRALPHLRGTAETGAMRTDRSWPIAEWRALRASAVEAPDLTDFDDDRRKVPSSAICLHLDPGGSPAARDFNMRIAESDALRLRRSQRGFRPSGRNLPRIDDLASCGAFNAPSVGFSDFGRR